ncbi:complex I NDUFA9 subunit family protein [Ruegeria sediminis]|uniref:Complex I NDUFA9 subunit family protein n=1 Tax=Ruegeria sediminis TaxID=2583820 RepID=A0ABY2X1G1_9RHOB|nr:complex I NDUFA9 subunit family protein [Ruegeria sediminis]TMV09045.1 complex I NDUFA9 subunit family protein [Ruegeria sediminis]
MTASKPERKVIVLGGTGFLGSRVVRELRNQGFAVSIGTRFPERVVRSPGGLDAEVAVARSDLRDAETLKRAFQGASAVVNCIGLYVETRTDSFRDVHVTGARNVAATAATLGVRDLIQISGIAATRDSPSAYVRARAEGEDEVRSAFPAATILRPSAMFSRSGALFGDLDALVRRMPVIPLFGDGSTRLQPVHAGDVAKAVSMTAGGAGHGGVFELGGPDVFTYKEILERLARRAGKRRLLMPVPFGVWWTLASTLSGLSNPPLTPAHVALMQRDNVVGEDAATFSDFGIEPQSAIALGLV